MGIVTQNYVSTSSHFSTAHFSKFAHSVHSVMAMATFFFLLPLYLSCVIMSAGGYLCCWFYGLFLYKVSQRRIYSLGHIV